MKNPSKHYLYARYKGMIYRCYLSTCKSYSNYGARGIKVCDRWRNDFWAYVQDIETVCGPMREPGMQVDRIDNDGNYDPWNVRWANHTEQQNNRQRKRKPKQMPPIDSRKTEVDPATLPRRARIKPHRFAPKQRFCRHPDDPTIVPIARARKRAISDYDIRAIRNETRYNDEIAQTYNVAPSTIAGIRAWRTYTDVN